ncbi:MAG: flagellin [Actinomycetota bacterium]
MRVSHETLIDQSLRRLQGRLRSFEDIQVQLGTGKRFQVASEDVPGMNVGLTLRAEMRSLEQAGRNADDGEARVNTADSKLQQMVTSMRRARELTVRGATELNQDERNAIALEISQIRDELLSSANSSYLDQGLFGGFAAADAVTNVAGTWTYTGDTGAVIRRVADGENVQVNVTGDEVFGFNAGQDVFSVLDDLEADLLGGDQAAVAGRLGDLDDRLDGLLSGLAQLGAAGGRIEAAQLRNEEQQGVLLTRLTEVEDVDLTEAVMELQTQEVALQATLGALSRALQPSLVEFLG